MIVLDTNVLSELMKPSPDAFVRDWLTRLGDVPMATTAVTVAEIEFGLQRLPQGRRRDGFYASFETFIAALTVLPLDDVAAREAGRLRAIREAAGLPSQPSDMMIAGTAVTAAAVLATRNVRDFEGLPLQIIDPWRSH
ncbi:PIN domain-containing protein [Brevundimonas sp. VNH65]|uniref:PIN domain-containing protein n=1 Tax=Brevundimonas sp. VNH65 TaxID=3400917 RepID=UPI003C083BA1